MNRVLSSIDRMEKQIKSRIAEGIVTKQTVEENNKLLDLSIEEHSRFQTTKTLAQQCGILTLEEAMTVYNLLGESVTVFNKQPLHVKAVLTKLLSELMA